MNKDDVKLFTVGQLVKALKKELKNYPEDEYPDLFFNVSCCFEDESEADEEESSHEAYLVGMKVDDDGDLCLEFEEQEFDVDCWDIETLLDELDSYDSTEKVYMSAIVQDPEIHGLYLNFQKSASGPSVSSDEDEEFICLDAEIFGRFKVEAPKRSYADELTEKVNRQKKRKNALETIALACLTVLLAVGFIYNLIAIIKHTGSSMFLSIIYAVVCLILFVICSLTLYYSKD